MTQRRLDRVRVLKEGILQEVRGQGQFDPLRMTKWFLVEFIYGRTPFRR